MLGVGAVFVDGVTVGLVECDVVGVVEAVGVAAVCAVGVVGVVGVGEVGVGVIGGLDVAVLGAVGVVVVDTAGGTAVDGAVARSAEVVVTGVAGVGTGSVAGVGASVGADAVGVLSVGGGGRSTAEAGPARDANRAKQANESPTRSAPRQRPRRCKSIAMSTAFASERIRVFDEKETAVISAAAPARDPSADGPTQPAADLETGTHVWLPHECCTVSRSRGRIPPLGGSRARASRLSFDAISGPA